MRPIVMKGDFLRKEVVATGAVTPGMQVSVAGAAGGGLRKAFALVNDLLGRSIDDAYAIGDIVQVGIPQPGAEVNAFLAAGENVTAGTALVGDGAGALVAQGTGEEASVLGFAAEAVNNATSLPVRIVVEIA